MPAAAITQTWNSRAIFPAAEVRRRLQDEVLRSQGKRCPPRRVGAGSRLAQDGFRGHRARGSAPCPDPARKGGPARRIRKCGRSG